MEYLKKIGGYCIAFLRASRAVLRARVFTRENAWVILVSLMLLLILVLSSAGSQPRFVYGGF